jgi:IS1 family transposase
MFIIGLKKTNPAAPIWVSETTATEIFEMDELYHFIEYKPTHETRENIYVTTLVSREPRQIVGFDVAEDKSPERLQRIVDSAPEAKSYATDGFFGYVDLVYSGKHIRNISNKNDTFTVEGINADLRHYIPVLARRSRCFCRTLETLKAVLAVFVNAYNRFGAAKMAYRVRRNLGKESRELPFGVVVFL